MSASQSGGARMEWLATRNRDSGVPALGRSGYMLTMLNPAKSRSNTNANANA